MSRRTGTKPPGIVVLGGGFAGVAAAFAADALRRRRMTPELPITVVNRDRWLTLRPRLYEPDPTGHRVDLVPLLAERDIALVTATAKGIVPERGAVDLDGATLGYDRLVVATGSALRRPDVPGAAQWAFDVDTHSNATKLHRHLGGLDGRRPNAGRGVVVGAGLAGIEVATSLAGSLRTLAEERLIDEPVQVHLVDPATTVADLVGAAPSAELQRAFDLSGVELVLGRRVAEVRPDGVVLDSGDHLSAGTTVWTGGLRPSPLLADLGVRTEPDGRVSVDPTLAVRTHSDVYAAGDVAVAAADETHGTVMSCQHAIPMGDAAGHNAAASVLGVPERAFRAQPYVTCIDVGVAGGIFTTGWDRQIVASGVDGRAIKTDIIHMIDPRRWGETAVAARAAIP